MFKTAQERGFRPEIVIFDSWYSGLDTLKLLRQQHWAWLCRLKSNRQVDPNRTGNVAISQLAIPAEGKLVHLKGYGMVKVWRTVDKDGDAQYWASSKLEMSFEQFKAYAAQAWTIESYHRAIKQCGNKEPRRKRTGYLLEQPSLLNLM